MIRGLESNITAGYEYFIILPDYYTGEGSVKSTVESATSESTFKTELASDSGINFNIVAI